MKIVSEENENHLRRYFESSQKIFRMASEDNSNVTFLFKNIADEKGSEDEDVKGCEGLLF